MEEYDSGGVYIINRAVLVFDRASIKKASDENHWLVKVYVCSVIAKQYLIVLLRKLK